MKFEGSKTAFIECRDCGKQSPKFRAYLYNDDDFLEWKGKEPRGWEITDEEELGEDGHVWGYCSTCLERNPK